jgi:hypothetical protein
MPRRCPASIIGGSTTRPRSADAFALLRARRERPAVLVRVAGHCTLVRIAVNVIGARLEKERVVGKTERYVARIVVGSPPCGRLRIASFQYLDGDLVGYKVVVTCLLLLKVNYIYALRVIIFACVGKLQPEPCPIDPIRGITTRRNLDGESASEHIVGLGEGYRVHQDGNKVAILRITGSSCGLEASYCYFCKASRAVLEDTLRISEQHRELIRSDQAPLVRAVGGLSY